MPNAEQQREPANSARIGAGDAPTAVLLVGMTMVMVCSSLRPWPGLGYTHAVGVAVL